MLELAEEHRPDLVVISGDLTQRAKPWQFREARAFVDRLGVPSVVVPGNHDVPMYRVWERALSPYRAYRKHFSEDLEPVFDDGDLLVIGINTAFSWTVKDGRILRSRLRQVERLLAKAPDDRTRIIVAHHELVPAPRFDTQRVLSGARTAVDIFARQRVEMVLSGHLHQSYVLSSEAYYPSGRRPFLIVHAGTTTSRRGRGCERRRYTCNWIRILPDEIEISHLGWDTKVRRFVKWSRHHFPRRSSEPYALESP